MSHWKTPNYCSLTKFIYNSFWYHLNCPAIVLSDCKGLTSQPYLEICLNFFTIETKRHLLLRMIHQMDVFYYHIHYYMKHHFRFLFQPVKNYFFYNLCLIVYFNRGCFHRYYYPDSNYSCNHCLKRYFDHDLRLCSINLADNHCYMKYWDHHFYYYFMDQHFFSNFHSFISFYSYHLLTNLSTFFYQTCQLNYLMIFLM